MNNSIQSHAENAVVSYQYPYYITIKISDLLNINIENSFSLWCNNFTIFTE